MKEKKQYRVPQIKAYQVKLVNIFCTSPTNSTSSTEELVEEKFDWN